MRKVIAALVLALFFTSSTAGHVTSPPLVYSDFKPVVLDFSDKKEVEKTPIPYILDHLETPSSTGRPKVKIQQPQAIIQVVGKPQTGSGKWILDPEVSWYGPGFYGHRTACGKAYTRQILGVARRTLPCGTKIEFKWKDKQIVVPVIDRGPYVSGRIFDLSGGLCTYLNHCFTGPIYYRILAH